MSLSEEDHVIMAQNAALAGNRPHEILKLLLSSLEPKWPDHVPRIDIERYLMRAFDVPLRVVRDIEPWTGFAESGDVTDHDIDTLLEPWISRFLEQHKQA
jgi:hypothetical protein